MDKNLGVTISKTDSIGIVAFKSTSISKLEDITAASEQIKGFIEENHPAKMVFDFGGVRFFTSQVLGLLLEIRAKLETYDGEIVISAINPQLHRVFKITNLDTIFKFFPNKESAVKAISTG